MDNPVPPPPPGFFEAGPTIEPATNDRAYKLAWQDVQRTQLNQRTGPATDPTNSHWINKFDLGNSSVTWLWGRIVDAVAYTNAYRVQFENCVTTLLCTMGVNTGLQPIGAKEYGQVPPGASVLVALHGSDTSGTIMAVEPEFMVSGQNNTSDFISQAGAAGIAVDEAHKTPIRLPDNGLITDWSCGRPFDQTTAGEKGYITETGVAFHVDSYMAFMRASEEAGIWAFYHDDLLRMHGRCMQQWSACREREDLDDEGEVTSVEGYTPYYWEALGAFDYSMITLRDYDPAEWQLDPNKQAYSALEPYNDNQQGFFRVRDFYGYLGEGHKRVEQILPVIEQDLVQIYPDKLIMPGVYEENLALTGSKYIRTARDYIIVKHLAIPSPKQIVRQEDPAGDNSKTYKAAGLLGDGPEHKMTAEMRIPGNDPAHLLRVAGFLDQQAFNFNGEMSNSFYRHQKDWYLPEERELTYAVSQPIEFNKLQNAHVLPLPQTVDLEVDHRYGAISYYPNLSYWALLADGGSVWSDGFCSEIRMSGGNIEINMPGDLSINAGRTVSIRAGKDFVANANHSFDISANKRDGRIKAEHCLYMLGGNDECGGVLVESRAAIPLIDFAGKGDENTVAGIVLKAPDSFVGVCTTNFIVTSPPDVEPGKTNIVLQAAGGRIRFFSDYVERFLAKAAFDIFVEKDDTGHDKVQTQGDVTENDSTYILSSSSSSAGANTAEGDVVYVGVPELTLAGWGNQPVGDLDTGPDDCPPPNIDSKTFGRVRAIRANEYWPTSALFSSGVQVNGRIVGTECLFVNGDVCAVAGHFYSVRATAVGGRVTTLKDDQLTNVQRNIDIVNSRSTDLIVILQTELDQFVDYMDDLPACDAEFQYRTTSQCGASSWIMFETRWQQAARLTGQVVNRWSENPVWTNAGEPTYPYPGKDSWFLNKNYRTVDLRYHNPSTNIAIDRANDAYVNDPHYSEPYAVTPDGNYPTIY